MHIRNQKIGLFLSFKNKGMIEINKKEAMEAFERILNIMDELREKCPWDQKQTIQTLRKLTIEETYELADAITNNDFEEVKKELGDVLLHIIFYAKIGSEENKFTITDVINSLCEKLIVRHPHIYGDVTVNDEEDVKRNWEQIKLKEGKTSILQGVPVSLPAMTKANRIQEKVKSVGFDWDNKEQVWAKLNEELAELQAEVLVNDTERIEKEMGDVLFSVINYARFLDVDPENALEKTNKKFMARFQYMEKRVKEKNLDLNQLSLAEMDVYWDEAKKIYQ